MYHYDDDLELDEDEIPPCPETARINVRFWDIVDASYPTAREWLELMARSKRLVSLYVL